MVHSGGFYQVEKRRPGPGEVPAVLHWFKWEAMLTWISGMVPLALGFFFGGAYPLHPGISPIGRGTPIPPRVGPVFFCCPPSRGLWRGRLVLRPRPPPRSSPP